MRIPNLFLVIASFYVASTCIATGTPIKETPIPVSFSEDRIFLNIKSKNSELRFLIDSGGSIFPFVYDDTARVLELKKLGTFFDSDESIDYTAIDDRFYTQLPHFKLNWAKKVRILKYNVDRSGKPMSDEPSQLRFILGDGFIGASFFDYQIWHLDYLSKKVSMASRLPDLKMNVKFNIFFKTIGKKYSTFQPRIKVSIDGEEISMLLDTGATSISTEQTSKIIGYDKKVFASSFIAKSLFEKLKKIHPDWKIIPNAELINGKNDFLQVPEIKFAGHVVGPVWFAVRSDKVYQEYSKRFMDEQISGALGGNFLKYFDLWLDYKRGIGMARAIH